jgi:4a-hydroxytetrahydrobiopterin dehydratase
MNLTGQKCQPCESNQAPMSKANAQSYIDQLTDWQLDNSGTKISKLFQFKGFYKTMAFVNAVAWIANKEGHHPDLAVGYNYCRVNFSTHAINGLSENDFICAAKVDTLFD